MDTVVGYEELFQKMMYNKKMQAKNCKWPDSLYIVPQCLEEDLFGPTEVTFIAAKYVDNEFVGMHSYSFDLSYWEEMSSEKSASSCDHDLIPSAMDGKLWCRKCGHKNA